MNALNHGLTRIFDLLLAPLEALGRPFALIATSAVFGVLALVAFKHVSSQKRIHAAKDRIKAHLIEIRIYQDDLAIVGKAIGKVLLGNLRYLGLNFAPFVPLSIPFVVILAQLVVRYGYSPVVVHGAEEALLPGRGAMIEVELARGRAAEITGLRIELPDGVRALSPIVRIPAEGRAYQEVAASRPGTGEIAFVLADGARARKRIAAGRRTGPMQPERSKGVFSALLWPAEDALEKDSPFERLRVEYPENRFGWLPGGPGGVLIVFFVASMAAGLIVLRPLKIQI